MRVNEFGKCWPKFGSSRDNRSGARLPSFCFTHFHFHSWYLRASYHSASEFDDYSCPLAVRSALPKPEAKKRANEGRLAHSVPSLVWSGPKSNKEFVMAIGKGQPSASVCLTQWARPWLRDSDTELAFHSPGSQLSLTWPQKKRQYHRMHIKLLSFTSSFFSS